MSNKRNRQPDPGNELNGNSMKPNNEFIIGTQCPHIAKAVNFSNIKKHIHKCGVAVDCVTCTKTKNEKARVEQSEENCQTPTCEIKPSTWMCLQCGHQGCGNIVQGHAFEHYVKPHSDCHSVVADTLQWTVWCFQCENQISMNCGKKLQQTMEFVKKNWKTPCEFANNPIHHERPKIFLQMHKEKVKQEDAMPQINCPKGLINPGNNCFFNAVLQCLAQTPFITKVLQDTSEPGKKFILGGGKHKIPDTSEELELPPIEGTLEGWGNFTSTLCDTLLRIRNPTGNSGFYPSEIYTTFRKKSTQCLDEGQHDSHELLRHLLDLIRNEDLRRYQSAILQEVGLNGKSNPEAVDERLKCIIKFYGNQANSRFLGLEPIFRGILISTIECLNCHHTSQKIEPFLDLSLPIMVDKLQLPGLKRTDFMSNPDFGAIGNIVYQRPSKHQLKKEKKASRKNRKRNRSQGNKEINHETANHDTSVIEDNGCSLESEECDANEEDNVDLSVSSDPIECIQISSNESSVTKDMDTDGSNYEMQVENHLQHTLDNANIMERRTKRKEYVAKYSPHNMVSDITADLAEVTFDQPSTTRPFEDGEYTILSCLHQFTAVELMTGNNKVACETCTVREKKTKETSKMICTPSTKQYLISRVPAVLILHLKRCEAQRIELRKVTKHVSFPLTLDLAPVCRRRKKRRVYGLYGVIQHSGTLHGGHYAAYVKSRVPLSSEDPRWSFLLSKVNENTSSSSDSDSETEDTTSPTAATVTPLPGKWFRVSDSRVIEVDEKTVLKSQAYLLFYERIL